MPSLTVTSKGQVTLRKELLRHLGVSPGERVDVEVLPGGRIQIQAERSPGTIEAFIGLLAGQSDRTATLEDLDAAAAEGWAGEKLATFDRQAAALLDAQGEPTMLLNGLTRG